MIQVLTEITTKGVNNLQCTIYVEYQIAIIQLRRRRKDCVIGTTQDIIYITKKRQLTILLTTA